jgi:multidrug resistance efflux pump
VPIEHVDCFGHVDVEGGVVSLYPAQLGRVVKVEVRENQEVKKDAELIRLDDRLAKLRVREAEAALEATQTQLTLSQSLQEQHALKVQQQEAAIRVAKEGLNAGVSELQRTEKLFKSGNASAEALAVAKAHVERLKAVLQAEEARMRELESHNRDAELALARARAEVAVVKSRLDQAQLALQECTMVAPGDGQVLRLQVGVGDLVSTQSLQPPIQFLPKKPLLIRAEVLQEFAGKIKEGQPAIIRDDGELSPVEWRGQVQSVSGWFARRRSILLEPGQMNDVRTLECIVKVSDGQSKSKPLRIGQRMRVSIAVNNEPLPNPVSSLPSLK